MLQAQAGTDPATVALMCSGLSGEHMCPFPDLSAGWRLGLSWRSVYRGAVCQRERGRCAQFI